MSEKPPGCLGFSAALILRSDEASSCRLGFFCRLWSWLSFVIPDTWGSGPMMITSYAQLCLCCTCFSCAILCPGTAMPIASVLSLRYPGTSSAPLEGAGTLSH